MESKIILSEIQKQYLSHLSGYYAEEEIRQIFFLTTEYLLNYSKIDTFLKGNEPISADKAEKYQDILIRLSAWEPVQYVLGQAWFYGHNFKVDKSVLIPRQETEELVQWIIQSEPDDACDLLDIGTGSGCIAVSLALNMPQVIVSACDISPDALAVAHFNAQLLKTTVNFFIWDLLDDHSMLHAKYRVMVSNPPYVRHQEKALMKKNVLNFEPALALFVPDHDPLLYYKRIVLIARKYLLDNGSLYLEINEHFPAEIIKLLKNAGFYAIEVRKDIHGKSRMVKAKNDKGQGTRDKENK